MRHDEELKRIIRKEIDDEFSYLDSNPSLHNVIMSKIEGERIVKRKVSMTLVFAIVMTIALGSMAVAASLGLFGQLRASKVDEMSYERLGLLEEAAVTVGETRRITASGVQKNAEPETVQEKLLADQMQREYDLTIDQVYCDGRKLYYSYTFKMNDDRLSMHEGEPTGFDSWGDACPGEKFEDVFDTWLGDEQNQKVSDWLNNHKKSYVVKHSAFVGDGAELPDGTIVTGKASPLLTASSAMILNALKILAGIDDSVLLIPPQVIKSAQRLKVEYLGNKNPRLHIDEMLIALSIIADTDETAERAFSKLPELRGCDVHSSVIISKIDESQYKKLGMFVSCEPEYQTKCLFHGS